MGMTILQAALLDSYVECYDFDQKLFLEPHLDYLLESLNSVYSNDLVDILDLIIRKYRISLIIIGIIKVRIKWRKVKLKMGNH
jgi:hypothetical protein